MAQQFDLFVTDDSAPAKAPAPSTMKHGPSIGLSEDEIVRHLQATGPVSYLRRVPSGRPLAPSFH